MKRRKILKSMLMVTGGMVFMPSCNPVSEKKVMAAYLNLNISREDQETMGYLCDAIIPPDKNFKGAKELGVHGYVLLMVNDCLTQEDQKNFMEGLQDFKKYSSQNGKNLSSDPNKENWDEVINAIWQEKTVGGNHENKEKGNGMGKVDDFLKTVKQFSILGYTRSEYYMTSIMSYKMVPGKFKGSIPIKDQEKVNLYG